MRALDLLLFGWIAAGFRPNPLLLSFASAAAQGGAWASVFVLGWAAWARPAQRAYVMAALATCCAAAVLAPLLAAALDFPRPFMIGLSPAYIAHGDRGGLPSTHATVMFTVALIFLGHPKLRGAGLAIALLAAVIGWARVYVGVHFPLDIAAGILLAGLVASAFFGVRRLWTTPRTGLQRHGGAA
jgi:membrane-associated phospholipid phosphatase